MTNEEFRLRVKEEMDEIGKNRGILNDGSKFEVWFATKILGEEEGVVVDEYQIGGSGDEKIDLGICDDEHEFKFIIQCKYSDSEKMYNKDEVDQILGAINRIKTCPNDGNLKRKEFVKKV